MITDIVDVKGEQLNVGDYIAFGETTSSYNSIICTGRIIDIQKKKYQSHIKIQVIDDGSGYWYKKNSIKTMIYPRNYNNIVKMN